MAVENVPYSGEIVTRAEAKAAGLKRYFTGKPCVRGHLSQRMTNNGECPPCHPCFKANPDKKHAAQKKYEAANREKIRARGRKYSREHREQANAWANLPANRARTNESARKRYAQIKATIDPEEMREKWRAKYARNPVAAIAYTLKWRAANVEKLKEYRTATKDAAAKRSKEWQQKNPDKVAAKSKRWQLANPEWSAKRRKANPEATCAIKNARRARNRNAEGKHTAAEIKELFVKQGGRCAYCRASLKSGFDADHIQSLSRGGSNWISNIQLLCDPCNSRKWATDPIVFARRIGLLI